MRLLDFQLRGVAWSGENLGTVPDDNGVDLTFARGDLSVARVTYHEDATRSELVSRVGSLFVAEVAEIDTEARERGEWVEPPNARFVVRQSGWNEIDGKRVWQADAVGLRWLLDGEIVGWEVELNSDGYRDWNTTSAGEVMRDVILQAQNRVRGSGLDWCPWLTFNFTHSHDSNGVPWAARWPVTMPPQKTISDTLDKLVGYGMCEWEFRGFELFLVNPGGLTRDQSSGDAPIILRSSEATDAPEESSIGDVCTDVDFVGDEGFHETFHANDPDSRIGRFVRPVSQGAVSVRATAALHADRLLVPGAKPREKFTRASRNGVGTVLPFFDVRVGDRVLRESLEVREPADVIGCGLTRDDLGNVAWHYVLGDLIDSLLTKLTRKTEAAIAGAGVAGGDGTPPKVPGPDLRVPEKVGEVAATSDVDLSTGTPVGVVSLGWGAVERATDGTVMSMKSYEVWGRAAGVANASLLTVTAVPVVTIDKFTPGSVWEFTVRAVGENDVTGEFSDATPITVRSDVEPPPVPSSPLLRSVAGTIVVSWDGKGVGANTGQPVDMPPDFMHLRVWDFGENPGATPIASGVITSVDDFRILTQKKSGVTYFVGFTAVDRSGNESAMSVRRSVMGRSIADDPELVNEIGAELAVDSAFIGSLKAIIVTADMFQGKTFEGGRFVSRGPDGSRIEFTSSGYFQYSPDNRLVGSWTPREGFRVFDADTGRVEAQLGKLANGETSLAVRDPLSNVLVPLGSMAFGARGFYRFFTWSILLQSPGERWEIDTQSDVPFVVRANRAFISFGAAMTLMGSGGASGAISFYIYNSSGAQVYKPEGAAGAGTDAPIFTVSSPNNINATPFSRILVSLAPGTYTAKLAYRATMPQGATIQTMADFYNRVLVVDPV